MLFLVSIGEFVSYLIVEIIFVIFMYFFFELFKFIFGSGFFLFCGRFYCFDLVNCFGFQGFGLYEFIYGLVFDIVGQV